MTTLQPTAAMPATQAMPAMPAMPGIDAVDHDRRAGDPSPPGRRHYPEPPPPIRADFSRWRLPALARPCLYYVVSRVAVLLAAVGAKWYAPRLHLLNALTTGWDAKWYTLIAQHGYPHRIVEQSNGSPWAFFPGWPLLMRATVAVTHLSYAQATFALTFVLGLTSALAVWLAVREVFGTVIADRATLLYVFFPTSYVLSLGYSEALFITASGLCLFALSRRYWLTAAFAAVVGGLTKNFGVVLIVCVVFAAGQAAFTTRRVRPLLAVAIAPLGLASWLLYSWLMVGTPFAFVQAERIWGNAHFVWFVTPLLAVFDVLTSSAFFTKGQVAPCALAAVFVFAGILLLDKARERGLSIPRFWWVFTIAGALAVWSSYEPVSVLRYSMTVVTLYAAYAWRLRPSWDGPIVGMLGVTQGMFMVIALLGSQYPHSAALWP